MSDERRSKLPTAHTRPAETLLALTILVSLLVVGYWNVVFTGKSIVYTDNYNPLNPGLTEENYGPNFVKAEVWQRQGLTLYPNFHDPGATWWQWEPGAEFFRKGLREYELPFWDPYVAAGAPAMANLTQAFFFPPHVIVLLLGNGSVVRNAYYLILLLCSGFCTYLLLRWHGLSLIASLAGGIGYMFSGAMTQHVGSMVGQSAALIPLAIFCTRWFLERPDWWRVGALAGCYATIALASFPPVLVQLFGFAAAYALTMARYARGSLLRSVVLTRYGCAVATAVALVAFYYVPAFYALVSSEQVRECYRHAGLVAWPPISLYQLLSPVLMGGVDVYQTPLVPDMQYYYLPYFGIVGFWWAALGDRRGEGVHGPLFLFSALAAIVVAMKLLGMPPVQWISYLPGFSSIHYAMYHGIGLNFLLAVMAAIGVENLISSRVSRVRFWFLCAFSALALGSLLAIASVKHVLQSGIHRWLFEWIALSGLAVLAASILAAVLLWPRRRGWIAIAVLGLFFLEGARNAFYPRQVRANVFQHPPAYIRLLEQKGPWSRLYSLGPLPANTNSAFSLSSWDSLMTVSPDKSFQLYSRYTGTHDYPFLRGATTLPPEPVLDAAGIDLILMHTSSEAQVASAKGRGYSRLLENDGVSVFQRVAEARCFFTSDFTVVGGPESMDLVSRPRSLRQILVEQSPVNLKAVENKPDDKPVTLAKPGRNNWRVRVNAPRAGFLYCSESFFDGWSAKVNGRAVPIQVANAAFRAVRVDAGLSAVEFSYWPKGLTIGLLISGFGLAALCASAIYGFKRPREE